jgi:hypothetical protein
VSVIGEYSLAFADSGLNQLTRRQRRAPLVSLLPLGSLSETPGPGRVVNFSKGSLTLLPAVNNPFSSLQHLSQPSPNPANLRHRLAVFPTVFVPV